MTEPNTIINRIGSWFKHATRLENDPIGQAHDKNGESGATTALGALSSSAAHSCGPGRNAIRQSKTCRAESRRSAT